MRSYAIRKTQRPTVVYTPMIASTSVSRGANLSWRKDSFAMLSFFNAWMIFSDPGFYVSTCHNLYCYKKNNTNGGGGLSLRLLSFCDCQCAMCTFGKVPCPQNWDLNPRAQLLKVSIAKQWTQVDGDRKQWTQVRCTGDECEPQHYYIYPTLRHKAYIGGEHVIFLFYMVSILFCGSKYACIQFSHIKWPILKF